MCSMLPSHIWDQFVSGNHNCFCRLYKGYYDGLYGYGLKLCKDPELVKDAIQNLFIIIWERREELATFHRQTFIFMSLCGEIFSDLRKKMLE